jgi:hypothetical protein
MTEPLDLRPTVTALAQALGGRPTWTTNSVDPPRLYIERFTLDVDGAEVTVVPTLLKTTLEGASFAVQLRQPITTAPVVLRQETWTDRLGSWLRVNREFRNGDAAFDRTVYIESDATDATLARLFTPPAARAIATEFLANGANMRLEIDPAGTLVLHVPQVRTADRDLVLARCSKLVAWARALESTLAPAGPYRDGALLDPPMPKRYLRGTVLFAGAIGTWIVAAVADHPKTLDDGPFLLGAGVGAGLWITGMAVAIALMRGRSTSLRTLAWFAFLSLGALPMGGRLANVFNGSGPQETLDVPATVVDRRGKHGPYGVLVLPDGKELLAPRANFAERSQGKAHVLLGPGRLGARWLRAIPEP